MFSEWAFQDKTDGQIPSQRNCSVSDTKALHILMPYHTGQMTETQPNEKFTSKPGNQLTFTLELAQCLHSLFGALRRLLDHLDEVFEPV